MHNIQKSQLRQNTNFKAFLLHLKALNMSGNPKTDAELIQCTSSVDIALFPQAKDNLIAPDYGKHILQSIHTSKFFFFLVV